MRTILRRGKQSAFLGLTAIYLAHAICVLRKPAAAVPTARPEVGLDTGIAHSASGMAGDLHVNVA